MSSTKEQLYSGDMVEVENMVKETVKARQDLEVSQMAEISGIKGEQFGKEIFSSLIKFKDLAKFLQVFPDVQRDVVQRKVASIKTYVLSALEEGSTMRFFSSMTCTCRGNVYYDALMNRIAIDTHKSRLSVNDGQHRHLGISAAIEHLENTASNHREKEVRIKATKQLHSLREMVVPLVIFNQIDEVHERQLFHDLNTLAQRPSRNAIIKLSQTDSLARMARELAVENHYLVNYGVEMDKMSISGTKNKNFILLSTIHAFIKLLYWGQYKKDHNFINEDNYDEYKEKTNEILLQVFRSLPHDLNTRGKYLVERNYTLRGISKFIHHCMFEIEIDHDLIYSAIKRVDWTYNYTKWSLYGASRSAKGYLQFPSNGESGVVAVFDACMDGLKFKSNQVTLEELENEKDGRNVG